jgi:esterase/lipase superfamily enzyme
MSDFRKKPPSLGRKLLPLIAGIAGVAGLILLVSSWLESPSSYKVTSAPTPSEKSSASAIPTPRGTSTPRALPRRAARKRIAQTPPPRVARVYAVQRVFYATDRAENTNGGKSAISYSSGRGERLSYGYADVSIPPGHSYGSVDRPFSIFGIELLPATPSKDMVILHVYAESEPDFKNGLSHSGHEREALLFIHGFNVTWESALLRTAQLAYDLKINGPSIAYDWPSAGKPLAYRVDQQNAEWTAGHLADFLELLTAHTGIRKLHVVAHSMGNYALALALVQLAARGQGLQRVHDIAMAAPDVDAAVFTTQYASLFRLDAKQVAIYESSRDKAMVASEKFNGYDRLGDAHRITVVPGFEVVDATRIDTDFLGHGYFANSGALMGDLVGLFQDRPMPRYPLLTIAVANGAYYAWPNGYK